jgi:Cu/Ag efflux pump CusA
MIGHIIAWSLRNKLFVVWPAYPAAGLGRLAGGPDTGRRLPRSHRPGGHRRHRGARHGADRRREPGHLSHRNRTERRARRAAGALGHQDRPVGRHRRVRVGHRPLPGAPGGGRTPATGPRHLAAGHPGAGDDAGVVDHGRDPVHRAPFRKAFDGMELKNAAEQVLKRRILAVPGVAEVLPIGGDTQQFQVTVKPERLAAYGLTLDEVSQALRDSNQNATAGFYVESAQEYLIQGQGRINVLDDIAETVVTLRDGQPVLIRHIAEVGIGAAPKRGVGSHNGKPAVILGIQKQPGANTLELTDRLDRTLDDIQAGLPAGMKIERHIFRQADFIRVSIDNLFAALSEGAVLVIAIVFAFLLSARATAITLVAIPLSLVAAILSMKALGATINTMTLGGMAIALGALVDDAIIVVENIVRRLRENLLKPDGEQRAALHVVFEATKEIQGSIVFATLIIMLVFMPLFFLSGVEGRLMVPLGFAYVISLAASLLVAITVTPVLAALFLPGSKIVRDNVEPRFIHFLHATYRRALEATVTRWQMLTGVSVVALLISLVVLSFAGRAFLPDFNEGTLTIGTATLPGTALEESDRLGQMVEQILLSHPEVVATARRTGRAEGDPHAMDVSASEMEVTLKMGERSKADFLAALRADLATVPGHADCRRPADLPPHRPHAVGQPIEHRSQDIRPGFGRTTPLDRSDQGRGETVSKARLTSPTSSRTTSPS